MGSSVVPAQQPLGSEKWELISSVTASGSTVTSFTSIAGYSKLKLITKLTATSAVSKVSCQFNSDTGNKYSSVEDLLTSISSTIRGTSIPLSPEGNNLAGVLTINNVATTGIKNVQGYSSSDNSGSSYYYKSLIDGDYETTSAITSLNLNINVGTYSGNVSLYGVAL